jgi:voltage-gated potassium channel
MYKRFKQRIHDIIEPRNNDSIAARLFDLFIISLIILNIFLIIIETVNDFSQDAKDIFRYIEIISVSIFLIEYILRVWVSDLDKPEMNPFAARIKYMFSFMALIDLIAILPFFLPFTAVDLRILRMIRLLRIFRVLKINRYTNALNTVASVIKRKGSQLILSTLVVIILMVMVSVLIYNIEHEAQPEIFQNAFSGLWWAVNTLTTVGYGDIYPITTAGKILSGIISLLGIGLIAVPTGIISAGFVENITKDKTENKKMRHYCPNCGEKIE